ncbi:hypothetical protein B0T18DRAFT_415393 [Schizothecium vesticola]|uniref:DUF6594 domain-containing protein n=1 Tax=Schizothecium vesticola TaxID=314040 RepID=A0AA40EQD2_9PEZI|nr:hypothetical protein B0T18DRAFT_415393 [Schizothecium vesticola]
MAQMQPPNDDENIVLYVQRSLEEEEEFHFLRHEFLQRVNITNLGVKLVRLKSRIQKNQKAGEEDLETLQKYLEDYTTAIRNYRYHHGHKELDKAELRGRKLLLSRFFQSKDDFNDPFHSHYAFFKDDDGLIDPLRKIFMKYLPLRLTYSAQERRQRRKEYSEGKEPKYVSKFVDRSVRLLVALTGGLFLVAPMIVMTIDASQNKSLITVSVAVVLFALSLSFGVKVSNVETLVSTATYAAVLVVFVGTSAGNSGSTDSVS